MRSPGQAIVMLALLVGLVAALAGCLSSLTGEGRKPQRSIQEVLDAHTDAWLAVPGVVGTAVGTFAGRPAIKVFISTLTPEVEDRIPSEVEGYQVVIVESGEVRALDGR